MAIYRIKADVRFSYSGSYSREVCEEIEAQTKEEAEQKFDDLLEDCGDPYACDLDLEDIDVGDLEVEIISYEGGIPKLPSKCLTKQSIMEFKEAKSA